MMRKVLLMGVASLMLNASPAKADSFWTIFDMHDYSCRDRVGYVSSPETMRAYYAATGHTVEGEVHTLPDGGTYALMWVPETGIGIVFFPSRDECTKVADLMQAHAR